MAEKMKRRIPKWDVAAELHVDTVGHESALLAKVDDPCMNLTVVDSMNPIISMNVDSSGINQSATQSGEEGNNIIIHSDDICEKTQFSGQFDLEDDCKYGLKKQDWEPASQDRTIAKHAENQDKSHSDDICEKTLFSGKFDLEDDCKYGLKKQDWEPASQDRTTAEHTENQDKSHSDDICEKTQFSGQFDLEDDCKYGLKKQDWEPASQDRTIAKHTENQEKSHSDDICEKTQFSGQFDLEDDCKYGLKKQDWEPASQDRTIAEHTKNQDTSHSDDICEKTQFSGQFDLEDDCKYGLKKQDWEPASQDRTIAEHTKNQDKSHSDDICEKTQFSGQFDLEDDCKYGLKKQDWEPASQDRTIAEHTENQEKSHKVVHDMSLDPEERHQRTHNMSPVDDRSRLHRKRSRSRSPSHDSRSRSWNGSRGKSPSYVSKQGSDRWTDKGRMRGMTAACRAFAAGKCRRGNECSYLHEGGCLRQIDRHHGARLTDGRGITLERERQLVYGSNETITDTGERNKDSQEKHSGMHEEHHEDGSAANIQHHGYRSDERCFDFTKGRCFRGEACRYVHHDASSDGGWSEKDEFRGRVHDGRDGSASFTRRIQHQKLSDIPCKYFLRGHCVHGEGCKFYHQLGPLNIPVERSLDGSQHSFVSGGRAGNIRSANASEQQNQTAQYSSTNPRGENLPGVSDTHHIDKQNFSKRSLCDGHPALCQDGHKKPHSSEQRATISEVCEELSVNNPLPTTVIACQNAESRGQKQSAPQILHAKNLKGQFAPPIPLKGQMLQVMHSHYQNGKNQFTALDKPPDAHSFTANIQNHSANPSCYQLNPQNLDSRGQVPQNLSMLSHSGSNFNQNGQIQKNGPLIHNFQNQPDFNVGGQNQRILASHSGHGQQDSSQNILHENVQSQVQNVPAHVSNGQNNLVGVPQPSLNPQLLNSDDKNCQLTMKNSSIQLGHDADSSEVKPSQFNSDNSITHKVVTSEQAAKITGLSASLAQFFGTAARNPNSISSFVTPVAQLPTEVEGSQTNLSHSTPKHNEQIHVIATKQVDDSLSRKVEKIEAHGINKEHPAKLQNGGAESGKDVDTKKIKEAKEIRLFKCALVEFVKDTLKPKWKEGQLSKEAYKTIVKKVVEKVCGSLQGPNVPQTQEKIDLYLLNCKAKLTKLVQAYVEKFVNS